MISPSKSEWTPVFHIHSSLTPSFSGSDVHETGWIIEWPNHFMPNVKVTIHPCGDTREMYMPWQDRPDMFSDFLTNSCAFRLAVAIYANTITKYTLYVNEKQLSSEMQTSGTILGELATLSLFKRYALEAHIPRQYNVSAMPLIDETFGNYTDWNPAMQLSREQQNSVRWMMNIELAVRSGKSLLMYQRYIPIGRDWAYDIVRECIFEHCSQSGWIKARYKGAVLIDSVGSGKTACALALVCASKPPPTIDATMLHSPATLVIVPMNLPQQWVEEVSKFTQKAPRTITLTSVRDVRGLSLQSLLECDLVITTTNFMKCKTYVDALDEIMRKTLNTSDKKAMRTISAQRSCSRALRQMERTGIFPLIELIRWDRLIIDEVHELYQHTACSKERLRLIKSIHAELHWGLTGTPDLSRSERVQSYYMFLSPKVCEDAEQHHHHPCLQSAVEHRLLQNFSKSHHEPSHIGHMIVPTARERILVESYESLLVEERIMIASYFSSAEDQTAINMKSIDEVCKIVHAQRCDKIADLTEKIDEDTEALKLCETREDSDASRSKKALGASIETLSSEKNSLERETTFFKQRITNLKTFECPICLEAPSCVIAQCGHGYCMDCANRLFSGQTNTQCPTCRANIDTKTTFEVSEEDDDNTRYGTKLCAACKCVYDLAQAGSNVLVFSQWKKVATAFQELLQKMGIAAPLLDGHTARRASILRNFKEGSGQALILLLERSSAGIHLACATHVVFLHAIVGGRLGNALGIEEQAIARALRTGQSEGGDGPSLRSRQNNRRKRMERDPLPCHADYQ